MGKKHKHPEHENLERWLVSYADFITLLFATFTALYAIASSDASKMKEVAEAIQEGFQSQSLMSGIQSILKGKSAASPSLLAKGQGKGAGVVGKYDCLTFKPGNTKREFRDTLEGLQSEVTQLNKRLRKGRSTASGVELAVQKRGIRVTLDSSLLFDPGSAVMKPQAREILDRVAARLKVVAQRRLIHIEGHTDNQPIVSALYPSNWELSTARSSGVVRYLVDKHGFPSANLASVGFADSRPRGDNATVEGRQKNRRIDIILYTASLARQIDPAAQPEDEEVLEKGGRQAPEQGASDEPAAEKPPAHDRLLKAEEEEPAESRLAPPVKASPGKKVFDPFKPAHPEASKAAGH